MSRFFSHRDFTLSLTPSLFCYDDSLSSPLLLSSHTLFGISTPPFPVLWIILGWQEAQWDAGGGLRIRVQLRKREGRRGRGHGGWQGWEGGDGLDNEIDAMRRGCCRANRMISDVKENEDKLMMRNGVNSIWMEKEGTRDLLLSHHSFSCLSGLTVYEFFTVTLNLKVLFGRFMCWLIECWLLLTNTHTLLAYTIQSHRKHCHIYLCFICVVMII